MTSRAFYQSISICPVCRKEKLFGDEKECLLCRAKKYDYLIKFRADNPTYAKDHRKQTYYRRVENHECTYCGAKLEDGYEYRMCEKCLRKQRNNLRRSRESRGQGRV